MIMIVTIQIKLSETIKHLQQTSSNLILILNIVHELTSLGVPNSSCGYGFNLPSWYFGFSAAPDDGPVVVIDDDEGFICVDFLASSKTTS
jgi:hypothetical protein